MLPHHLLIKRAILLNQPCPIRPNHQWDIPPVTLIELWTTVVGIRQPPLPWLEWLLHSTLNQAHAINPHHHPALSRFLAIALGRLITAQPKQDHHLQRWLTAIHHWETHQPISSELNHRRLQINQLLGNHQIIISETVEPSSASSQDPYIISTLLRSSNQSHELLQQLKGSQDQILRSIRVSCRSKGQLIHRTQPDGPHEPLSTTRFKQLLSTNHKPSLWRTGLILSQAECLVGQIRMIMQEPQQHDTQKLDEMLDRLKELLSLQLTEGEKTLYGGRLEAHRLMRRQADGLEAILEHLLLLPSELSVDLGLVLELIQGALQRLGPDIIRPRTWKLILSSHLKLSTQWSGLAGLERLLELVSLWASTRTALDICPELDEKPTSSSSILFKKLMPGDTGLIMIERVLFPEDHHHHHHQQQQQHQYEDLAHQKGKHVASGACDEQDAFERVVARITTMKRFLEAAGNPRRFRDRRLMRLIFLSVKKRHNAYNTLTDLDHDMHAQYVGDQQTGGGGPAYALDWWNRSDVWRELEFRLEPSTPTESLANLASPTTTTLPEEEEEEEGQALVDLSQLQFQLDLSSAVCPSHHQGHTSLGRVGRHHHPEQPRAPPREPKPPDDRGDGRGDSIGGDADEWKPPPPPSSTQSDGREISLDTVNQKLAVESRDFFNQHSLLVCLVQLLRDRMFS